MWRRGFYANRYYYYNLKENPTRLYLSDYFNLLTPPKNGWFTHLIDNKLYLPFWLKDFPEHVPQYHFLVTDRRVAALRDGRVVLDKDDPRALEAVLDVLETRKCVGKPIGRSCGEGLAVLEKRPEGLLRNNRPFSPEELGQLLRSERNYLISEYVEQHPYAVGLNASTTNTLRLLTCWDLEKNEPFIARGVQRIGRQGMFGADNAALGGLVTFIDLKEGRLGHIALAQGRPVQYVERHPDTGSQVRGVEIPHFQQITSTILEMCRAVSFIPYMAWDVVVTERSFKVLEVNSNSDIYLYQFFEPLLSDERLQRFYGQFAKGRTGRYFMR